ncbi:cell division protein FtsA [Alkalihalobacillus trypoxylicola]|uniref:Cell division protein n=1 Tax=Alkalihalobacillus trypoxylicola TaxID=519424 RepID=A0A161P7P2_9BACI|nr:cell division protein FtsA [Alkalihalobacillus trypoxylicola]KYG26678.1 cell division protein [Alkalihalobacillus trypoxylicola]
MDLSNENTLFALDIGTRSVVGLLLKPKGEKFELLDMEIVEHEERSMLDGQIHDVPSVAHVINKVKNSLELKHGPLKKVCVAAAGRSLKTKRAAYETTITGKPVLTHDDVLHLELSAVQQAQFELAQNDESQSSLHYFCVGYSVLNYQLDSDIIGSLIDQNGEKATVEVIATFLPKVVVESLLAALNRADLELEALTLEPIAAINVLIPPSMRRLNVALVDIGAGTSDIALTAENTVVAYGMVPIAGDEITEAISDHFLLDFPEAERVKREIHGNEQITFLDILGFEASHTKEEMIAPIREQIVQLAKKIAHEIIILNGKPPQAVMLVGGGSLTPELTKHLAQILKLPENRVAIRGADAIQKLEKSEVLPVGPDLVTPVGIAIAAKENPIEYMSITVNEQKVRLFDIKNLTVGDALLARGIEMGKLYGKPGLAIMVTISGKLISVPGELGEAPTLLKNGEATTLDARIYANDEIVVKQGKDGKQASVTIYDLYGDEPNLPLIINDEKIEISASFTQNGVKASKQHTVMDRDVIDVLYPKSIQDVLQSLQINSKYYEPISVQYQNKDIKLFHSDQIIVKNEKQAFLDDHIQKHEHLQFQTLKNKPTCTLADFVQQLELSIEKSIQIFFNDELITLKKNIYRFEKNGQPLSLSSLLTEGDHISVSKSEETSFILQDVFAVQEINIPTGGRAHIELTKNGASTGYADSIIDGDKIELLIHQES